MNIKLYNNEKKEIELVIDTKNRIIAETKTIFENPYKTEFTINFSVNRNMINLVNKRKENLALDYDYTLNNQDLYINKNNYELNYNGIVKNEIAKGYEYCYKSYHVKFKNSVEFGIRDLEVIWLKKYDPVLNNYQDLRIIDNEIEKDLLFIDDERIKERNEYLKNKLNQGYYAYVLKSIARSISEFDYKVFDHIEYSKEYINKSIIYKYIIKKLNTNYIYEKGLFELFEKLNINIDDVLNIIDDDFKNNIINEYK